MGAFLGEATFVGEFTLVGDWTLLGDVCTEEGLFFVQLQVTYNACLDGEVGLDVVAWTVVLAAQVLLMFYVVVQFASVEAFFVASYTGGPLAVPATAFVVDFVVDIVVS